MDAMDQATAVKVEPDMKALLQLKDEIYGLMKELATADQNGLLWIEQQLARVRVERCVERHKPRVRR